jgi:hypothetical protein
MTPRLRRLLDAALVATSLTGLALGLFLRSHSHREGPPRPPPAVALEGSAAPRVREPATSGWATTAELGLVAPLAPGSDLGGFGVREIRGVDQGHMRVVCAKGKEVVRLDIALADTDADAGDAPSPAASVGAYAIFYSLRGGATPADGEVLSLALALVVKANAAMPPPPGMAPFRPSVKKGMDL